MDGNEEVLHQLADQLDVPTNGLIDRWEGSPETVMEDIFQVPDMNTGELEDLTLFDVQKKVVQAYFYADAPKYNLYKGRRIGYSFIICLCFLLEALIKQNSFYPLVSRTKTQAKNRISDIQLLIDNAKVDIPCDPENKDEIRLFNGSGFMAFSGDPDTSRGDESARAVLMDEAAFIEDQEAAHRAFGAFIALGEDRAMVQVSTPDTRNDKFMQDHKAGTPTGRDKSGNPTTLSIKQPTFYNAKDIDINKSLLEQETRPVRPDINLYQIEEERQTDPEGFGQEYLCRPVVDEYRFFSEESIEIAMKKGQHGSYKSGLAPINSENYTVLGVDIGVDHDDTVLSVAEHNEEQRYQRYIEVLTDRLLAKLGIPNPDRGNPTDVAKRIGYVYNKVNADLCVMDRTGVGEGFQRTTERQLGRSIMGFNFSDKEGVADMMGDMNACLRNRNAVLLKTEPEKTIKNNLIYDQFASVVKEKKKEYSKPHFSGKDNAESGKDDTVFATAMSFFPPNRNSATTAPSTREKTTDDFVQSPTRKSEVDIKQKRESRFGSSKVDRNTRSRKKKYSR